MQALIVINDVNYVPERWQGTLLTWAAVIFVACFNVFAAKHLPLAEGIFCSVHIFSFVPVIVCLWVMTPTKQSASAVFTEFTDNGAGWPNMAATVLVGQVRYLREITRAGMGISVASLAFLELKFPKSAC